MAKPKKVTSGKFSWCFATKGHELHNTCPGKKGGSTCSCDCHSVEEAIIDNGDIQEDE